MGITALGWIVILWGIIVLSEGEASLEKKIRGIELCSLGFENIGSYYQQYSSSLYYAALETELPPEVLATAKKKGKALNLDEVIKEIAAEVGRYA